MKGNLPDSKRVKLDAMTRSSEASVRPDGLCSQRHREDLVGKRVLCLPRTFEVEAPSPFQLSSSLWSPSILKALKEHEAKGGSEPHWCPRHHHHQPNQKAFISLSESIKLRSTSQNSESIDTDGATLAGTSTSGATNKRSRSRQQHSGAHKKNSPFNTCSRQSFSVLKSARQRSIQSTNTDTMHLSSNVDDYDFEQSAAIINCDLCANNNTSVDNLENHSRLLALLPWRLGTVRAVSHRDLSDEAVSIMIEFDLLDWQNREWYPLRDTSVDENDQNVTSGDDHDNPLVSTSKQSSNTSNNQEHNTNGRGRPDVTVAARFEEDEAYSESSRDKSKRQTRDKDTSKENLTEDNLATFQDNLHKNRKARGAFKVVLVESSIGCLNRKNSPTGRDKLWPGLVSFTTILRINS